MSLETELSARAGGVCELCGAADGLAAYEIPPEGDGEADRAALLCATCRAQISGEADLDPRHWLCLNESAWSQTPAVQVLAWRLLQRLSAEPWAQDLAEQIYLDEETLAWAQAGAVTETEDAPQHRDSNGAALAAGDTVTLIKDLPVKGAGFTAKRGTAVRGVSLVPDNPGQIEGRVNGQHIVILTQFVKKSG